MNYKQISQKEFESYNTYALYPSNSINKFYKIFYKIDNDYRRCLVIRDNKHFKFYKFLVTQHNTIKTFLKNLESYSNVVDDKDIIYAIEMALL